MKTEILRELVNKWRDDSAGTGDREAYPDNQEGEVMDARDKASDAAVLGCANDLEQLLDILG